jgi:hypothetical protein
MQPIRRRNKVTLDQFSTKKCTSQAGAFFRWSKKWCQICIPTANQADPEQYRAAYLHVG